MRLRPIVVLVMCLMCITPGVVRAEYIYPLDSWLVSISQGVQLSDGTYHMGIDAGDELPAGANVYAIADGVVKEARVRTRFGLVVLVEHDTPEDGKHVSLYGHLRPSDVRVQVGQTVSAGDVIGVLGSPSENGGWPVHIHFGIHKSEYSPVWIYYGHVRDPGVGEQWYLPRPFIEDRFGIDRWSPTLELDIADGNVVGNTAQFTTDIRDIGHGLRSVEYKAKSVASGTTEKWQTVLEHNHTGGPQVVNVPLHSIADGDIQLRLVATDRAGNETTKTLTLVKDPNRNTTKAVVAVQGKKSNANLTQWSMGGTLMSAFYPLSQSWKNGADIASGYVTTADELQLIVARGNTTHKGKVIVYDEGGVEEHSFKPFPSGAIRVATGDVTGNGVEEIIVGSGRKTAAEVRVYTGAGELLWSMLPFNDMPFSGVDVATADTDADGVKEVIAGTGDGTTARVAVIAADGSQVLKRFKPFGKRYTGGVNVAGGNVFGGEREEIVVGSGGGRSGRIRAFNGRGKRKIDTIIPFGEEFVGAVDVSTFQWDLTDEIDTIDEIMVSQASKGQAWVNIIRPEAASAPVLSKRLYEASYFGGTRIDGWQ